MDWPDYLKFFFALIFVLSLMGGLAFVLKKLGYGQGGINTGKKRLKIIEVLPLDARRKAVILERDNSTQHLVLLGPSGDTVIETNIKPPKNDNAKE